MEMSSEGMLVFAFPYFSLLNTKSPLLIVVAMILSYTIGTMGMLAAELPFFTELFPTRVRYTGVALARELSAPIAGGIAPFIAVVLLVWSGGQVWPVVVYVMVMALISLVSVYLDPAELGCQAHIKGGRMSIEDFCLG